MGRGISMTLDETIHNVNDPQTTTEVFNILMKSDICKKRHGKNSVITYYNIPAAFDIETTSLKDEKTGEKAATMYIWQFGINGFVVVGRTWTEFKRFIELISVATNGIVIPVYVHNLSFEFQFIRKLFKWTEVFSSAQREPMYARTTDGIEFRDSLILTGLSLEKSAEELTKYKIEKMSGDLDYTKRRGSTTPMTDHEMRYCTHDVLVLNAIIQEKIEAEGNVAKIPMTKTGYVRRDIRRLCYSKDYKDSYERLMKRLKINGIGEYKELKEAFAGGFTHANPIWVGEDLKGRIDSFDFTSSYPAVILSEQFPMTRGSRIVDHKKEVYLSYNRKCLSIARVTFKNIRMKKEAPDSIISFSKCRNVAGAVLNNGRVSAAKTLETTITNIDFESIAKFYDFDDWDYKDCYIYGKGYLPKPIIESTLKYYEGKTTLKGIDSKKAEYQLLKGMLNSIYGCMVTDFCKDEITYRDEWGEEEVDVEEAVEEYNEQRGRFLFYPWGVFVTAYARRNLYSGILAFGQFDYVYSDTDSIKCLNVENHMDYIKEYNSVITGKIATCLNHYDIPLERMKPKNKAGVEKQIGIWDWETEKEPYTEFKTLGAKRYIVRHGNDFEITIAGVSKEAGSKYLLGTGDPFGQFRDGLTFTESNSGKLTHTYIDEKKEGYFKDYLGEIQHYEELSAVHLEPASYTLSMDEKFIDYVYTKRKEVYR